jgi:hypothetical protein
MARASEYTFLSLDRYAKIMGINPLHFAGGQTPGLNPIIFPDTGCNSIWFQYDWQNYDQVSREQLAEAIRSSEDDIMRVVGFPPAPMWIEGEEVRAYPRNFAIDSVGYVRIPGGNITSNTFRDVRGNLKSITADYGKVISGGRRAMVSVGAATVGGGTLVYTDEDSDGFYETATITLPLPPSMSSLTDGCEFKAFFDGEVSLEWEIRYPKQATISGGNIILVYDSWLFIDPDLWEEYPTSDGPSAIDVSTINNFVTTVDVYREYIDTSQSSVRFFWENDSISGCDLCNGTGCVACSYTTQDGCMIIRDTELGMIVPFPATFDTDDCVWYGNNYSVNNTPNMVRLWYLAGDQSKAYLSCRTCDPLSTFWARIIARMATARLERPVCSCGNLVEVSNRLSEDLGQFSRASATFFQTDDIINCPFGTLRGEVEAWRRIKKVLRNTRSRKVSVAVI